MFRIKDNVPNVYPEESRDFQTVACLYDLVIQSNRFGIDLMKLTSDTMRCNNRLLPLIGSKVGLFSELKLNNYMYRKILSGFPYIMKYKGSIHGVQLVANLFERLMNTSVYIEQDPEDNNNLTLVFEGASPDITLLNVLLNYIKPTGVFINYAVRTTSEVSSDYSTSDSVTFNKFSVVTDGSKSSGMVSPTNTNVNLADQSLVEFTQLSKLGLLEEGETHE